MRHALIGDISTKMFADPDYWMVNRVATTGDLLTHPEVIHPPRHFYRSDELSELLERGGLQDVELGCAPAFIADLRAPLDQIESNPAAWRTVLELEEEAYWSHGLLDGGKFLLGKGTS